MKRMTRALILCLSTSLSFAGFMQSAQAATIGTEQLAAAELGPRSADDARALLEATLSRAEVVAGLQQRGIDPAQARARVDALSDHEAQALAQRIDTAPAGASDIIGAIVFIFVLLLLTDILGFTKIFPFTRSIR